MKPSLRMTLLSLAILVLSACGSGVSIGINDFEFNETFLTEEEARNNPAAQEDSYLYLQQSERLALKAPNTVFRDGEDLTQSGVTDESILSDLVVYLASDPEDEAAFDLLPSSVIEGASAFFVFPINDQVLYVVTLDDFEGEIEPLAFRANEGLDNVEILVGASEDGDGITEATVTILVDGKIRAFTDSVSIEVRP